MSRDQAGADTDSRLVRIAEAIVKGWSVDWIWEEQAFGAGIVGHRVGVELTF